MTTQYTVNDKWNGINGFGLPFCDTNFTANLAATVPGTVTIPGNPQQGPTVYQTEWYLAVFTYEVGRDVWVAKNQTAAVPAGGDFAASTSELRPVCKLVKAGDVLSFITADTNALVCVSIYKWLN